MSPIFGLHAKFLEGTTDELCPYLSRDKHFPMCPARRTIRKEAWLLLLVDLRT